MRRTSSAMALALAIAGLTGPGAKAQTPTAIGHADELAIKHIPAKATLTVSSPAFKDGGDIPYENTQYRGNRFPGLQWSQGPRGTQSYVVIMQGALGGGDDMSHGTSIHFILINVPARTTRLDAGLTTPPAGAMYGLNVHGPNQPYAGPHTHNFVEHNYHLQVFALDTVLPGDPMMSFPALEGFMAGHVLASGQTAGQAAMDPDSPEAKQIGKGRPAQD
ncbi:MAG TPA: YbhB/YbcL family Raf kinase inhibitor-like protein [Caulobacteraceae bacterium]|nr:YbhB/YbcL family Raf kinase inhibitor-like protein [Caulobacteraceae bacterium]